MNRATAWVAAVASVVGCATLRGGSGEVEQLPPATFAFQPTNVSYVAVSHRTVERDVEGRVVTEGSVLRYRLTADLAEQEESLQATLVVDTITAATAANVLPEEIARASGTKFVAQLAPNGRLENFPPNTSTSPLAERLANELEDFFPRVPNGGLRPGAAWVDTTESTRNQAGVRLTVRAVTRYDAGEWRDGDTPSTLAVSWVRDYEITGLGEQFGQPFTLTGTGSSSGVSSFSADGRYLGTAKQDELSGEIQIQSMGATVQLRQTQNDTVRVLAR